MALYCNATFTFGAYTGTEIKGFDVVRRSDPNFSAADLSSRISYVSAKNCVDILTIHTIDPGILAILQGTVDALNFTAMRADGGANLVFAGQGTVIGSEGAVQFADVESPCTVTFAVVSADGVNPNLSVT